MLMLPGRFGFPISTSSCGSRTFGSGRSSSASSTVKVAVFAPMPSASTSSMTTVSSAKCITIAANAYGLIARSTDPALNGMLPAPDATFGFSLVDSSGRIEVRDGATVLESVVWTSVFTPTTANPSGLSRALDPDETLSFATNGDAGVGGTANPSQQPWCQGTTPYGDMTNKGTPKADNACM